MNREEVLKSATDWFKGDDLRANVWVDKYCLKDNKGEYLESTPDDMFHRLAKEFARIESKYPNPLSEEEIYELFKDFRYIIPGGSMLYGIGNKFSYSSLGNCFVIGDQTDSYGSILKIDEEQIQLMKRRGGVGHDLSHLRPRGSVVSNAATTSTGAVSFMSRYSNSCREVAQGGRRGALMLTMNVDHPDIIDFIKAKDDLTKVTGANISVKVDDLFMTSIKNEDTYNQKIWDTLIHQAWKNAEPGVLFWDTIIKNSPADKYKEFESISTNPCGEIPLCAYDTCRLMSINLFSFVDEPFTKNAGFDYRGFRWVVTRAQRLMDDAIDLEAEKIKHILAKINRDPNTADTKLREQQLWYKIQDKLLKGRRTGLSAIGLADCFAGMNMQYGSEESISMADFIYSDLHDIAYQSSNIMSQERGPFPIWDSTIDEIPRRNIALLTIPPSGSLSILAGISSGIEPVFNLEYTRRRKVEVSDNVVYIDKQGDKWEEYKVYHSQYVEWYKQFIKDNRFAVSGEVWDELKFEKEVLSYIPDITKEQSPYYGATANEIDPMKRVELQAIIQKHIDHSISSTINLPKETTEQQIAEIYMAAWKMGCKGITIYREGCRDGVLINKDEKKTEFVQHSAPKRPTELKCNSHKVSIKGSQYSVIVGLLDDKPYEVFSISSSPLLKNDNQYITVKEKSGSYYITNSLLGLRADSFRLGLTEDITDEQKAITRLVSTALRHGTDIKFIVEQLNKTQGDLTSFNKAIARVLKQYITNGSHLKGSMCEVCGSKMVVENGCEICKACGQTRCG
jgi:ribonucleoside-diphosphate reductase alpha chain